MSWNGSVQERADSRLSKVIQPDNGFVDMKFSK